MKGQTHYINITIWRTITKRDDSLTGGLNSSGPWNIYNREEL